METRTTVRQNLALLVAQILCDSVEVKQLTTTIPIVQSKQQHRYSDCCRHETSSNCRYSHSDRQSRSVFDSRLTVRIVMLSLNRSNFRESKLI